MEKICGIYAIYSEYNGKIYIGSSIEIYNRIKRHFYHLIKNKHNNSPMQNTFNTYGINVFKTAIIEECSKEDLIVREQWYIDLFCAYNKEYGYNLSKTSDHPTISEDGILRIVKFMKEKTARGEYTIPPARYGDNNHFWNGGLPKCNICQEELSWYYIATCKKCIDKKISDRNKIIFEYLDEGKSNNEIMQLLNISHSLLWKVKKKHKSYIKRPNKEEINDRTQKIINLFKDGKNNIQIEILTNIKYHTVSNTIRKYKNELQEQNVS